MYKLPQKVRHFSQWLVAIALIWLVVLPWLARWSPVEQHLRLLDERRIDASAMFYTELEDRPTKSWISIR